MANAYEPVDNFTSRLRVETSFPDGKRDHRDGFSQQEYRKNLQDKPEEKEPMAGFPPMKGIVEAPKAKAGVKEKKTPSRRMSAKEKAAIDAANQKDLNRRNLNK